MLTIYHRLAFFNQATCNHTNPSTEAVAFTDAEKAVIAAVVQAIATAAVASFGPVATLSSGLTAIGATGVSDVVQSLQDAVASLQAAAAIDWNTS